MSHIMLRIVLMLLLVSHRVQAEKTAERIDPFQPLSSTRCLPAATLPLWQLKGVIGSDNRWTGWLTQPEVGWIKLVNGETIPLGNWVVSQLDKSGVTLIPTAREAGCDGLPDALLLASPFINKPDR
ncbi:HofP DNA utilization family protein [Pectobacterium fontis]|uniref:HofP n=1 Tax=Pectobacterium fontis TaxID=2558042 RepID=A0A7V8IKH6_9GAMM|nr:HofP DNA utilization family protein [Pectobacterium fontis]KHN53826.1 hofP [Pectobacterium fontis]